MGTVGDLSVCSVPVRILLCTLGIGDLVCFIGDGIGDELSVRLRDNIT